MLSISFRFRSVLFNSVLYGKMIKDGRINYRDVARLLRYAIEELKKDVSEDKFEYWASFIHIGVS